MARMQAAAARIRAPRPAAVRRLTSSGPGVPTDRSGHAQYMLRPLLGALAAALVLPAPAVAQIVGEEHAASPAGHLAFVTKGETSESTLRVVSPDGAVGAAEPITGDDETPTVAVGTRGDAIVAWADREHRLWARVSTRRRPARPAGTGRPERVGPGRGPSFGTRRGRRSHDRLGPGERPRRAARARPRPVDRLGAAAGAGRHRRLPAVARAGRQRQRRDRVQPARAEARQHRAGRGRRAGAGPAVRTAAGGRRCPAQRAVRARRHQRPRRRDRRLDRDPAPPPRRPTSSSPSTGSSGRPADLSDDRSSSAAAPTRPGRASRSRPRDA